jgi:tRNA/tmRNA/rRNA uracil-C5-methylase (TrmA/RlmC/RlmD family)
MTRRRSGSAAGSAATASPTPVGAVLELAPDGFAHGGEAVARAEGKAVLVAGALPGERVRAEVVEDHPRYARARTLEVLVAEPGRVEPPCPHARDCGGCDLQHVDPEVARALKTRVVREQLARLGGLGDAAAAVVAECRAVGPDLGYRSHVQLHAAPDGRLGFHREGTHEVVPVVRCPVATDAVNALRGAVGDATGARGAALRVLDGHGAAVLVPGDGPLDPPPADAPDAPATIALRGAEDRRGAPRPSTVLRGPDASTVTVAGIPYEVPVDAFFQANHGGAEALVATVLAAVGDVAHRDVWDLYAGVGLLALPLARAGAHVLAVEQAGRSAERLGVEMAVLAERVEPVLERAVAGDATLPPPEVVVADPPRAGLGRRTVEALGRLAPERIVLVACDVASLARDVRDLTARGYRLGRAEPLDLFPMTHHVEVVATLHRTAVTPPPA